MVALISAMDCSLALTRRRSVSMLAASAASMSAAISASAWSICACKLASSLPRASMSAALIATVGSL